MKKFFSFMAAALFAGSMMADPITCAEARTAALAGQTDQVTVRGYVTSIATAWSSQYNNITFWMADTEDGGQVFEAYRAVCNSAAEAPNVGDLVDVTGTLAKYNTTPELAAGCTYVIVQASAPAQNLGPKTIAEFLQMKNTKDTCILTGVVDSIANDQYGNLYISDATGQVYVYGVLTPAGESKKFGTLNVDVTDTLTIKALYGEFQGTPQAPNAIFVSVAKGAGIELEPITVAEALEIAAALTPEKGKSAYTNEKYAVMGYIVGTSTKYENTWYMADEPGAYGEFQAFKCATIDREVVEGDYVIVTGKIQNYYGEGTNGEYHNYEISGGNLVHVYGEGIENVVMTEKAQKVIVDGVMYIIRDNKMYNAQGAQVR